jgi:hypothetical protein
VRVYGVPVTPTRRAGLGFVQSGTPAVGRDNGAEHRRAVLEPGVAETGRPIRC